MEGSVFSPFGQQQDLLAMDLDVDDLLFEGCWLETTDGSDFLYQCPSVSNGTFEHPDVWPISENKNGNGNLSSCPSDTNDDVERQCLTKTSPQAEFTPSIFFNNQNLSYINGNGYPIQSDKYFSESYELHRRWWIGPQASPGPATTVTQRLMTALDNIREFTKNKDVLIQIWVPINRGGRRVLTTNEQPFSLMDPNCHRLTSYRNISVNYQFSAEENSNDFVGLPGRVFLEKVPEWTPDVRFFSSDEYPRVEHAQWYDVRGTLALPVFEQDSQTCLGVIEVVMTTQKTIYRPELETVCRALEAVDLRSSEALSIQNVKASNSSYQAAIPEIQKVMKSACETHRLPLAQTWVPCNQQGKEGCRHSDDNFFRCVSTVDQACYVADPRIKAFHEACSEHHLLKGQGVAGRAFLTNQPCFCANLTSLSKKEYPMSHHARMFGLCAAVAIRLRSIYTGTFDFVLEFFLPVDCKGSEEQKKMLSSLSIIIQQVCQTLRVVTDQELDESTMPTSELIVPSNSKPGNGGFPKTKHTDVENYPQEESSRVTSVAAVQLNDKVAPIFGQENTRGNSGKRSLDFSQGCSLTKEVDDGGDCSTLSESTLSTLSMARTGRRTKAEKTITLEVLRQYFAGSLKYAAKCIGVCPTTLKRICRQHGIKRWPSRKIKKVGHSLQKLQLVIDSVQGASGALRLGSFYNNFPELASPNLSGSNLTFNDHPKPLGTQPDDGILKVQAAGSKSSSLSCSQTSSSSHCSSSGTHQHPPAWHGTANDGDPDFKRIRSDAELLSSTHKAKVSLGSSIEHPNIEAPPPLPRNSGPLPQGAEALRVKVAYGDEKIRFRMQNGWRYKDLLQEIRKRYSIEDMSAFDLKYLDDDSELVLLTCDADLEECVDVSRSPQGHTMKLSLHVSPHCLGMSSGSSCPP